MHVLLWGLMPSCSNIDLSHTLTLTSYVCVC